VVLVLAILLVVILVLLVVLVVIIVLVVVVLVIVVLVVLVVTVPTGYFAGLGVRRRHQPSQGEQETLAKCLSRLQVSGQEAELQTEIWQPVCV